jgi:fibronectin-binding autotransporter adhesin
MRISGLLGAIVALGLSTAGHAASITILSQGDFGPPTGYGSGATFDNLSAEAYGSTAPYPSFLDGGASFSGSGIVMNNGGQDSLGLYATPFGDTTNYMAVLGGGSEEIAYAGFKNSFGLYWGSVDTYNSLTFYSGKVLVATITGADVDPPISANGGQTDYASNAYVLITGLPQFDRVFASSSSNSFEFDNVVAGGTSGLPSSIAAAPEPSTWAMLMLGFTGLGYAAFRRSKTPISAFA